MTIRRLRVRHETRYVYGALVELAHHMAHLRPRDTAWQDIRDFRLLISPEPEGGAAGVQESLDSWGNWRAVFSHDRVHAKLVVSASFVAELRPPGSWTAAHSPAWESARDRLRYRIGSPAGQAPGLDPAAEFVLASAFAPMTPALADYARSEFTPGRPLLDAADALMRRIHRDFEYKPLSTSVATRAPEALARRQGVCQDFAHVMIGALRSVGLAARYVSGYLLTQPPPGQERLVGADASHAWVAVWCPVHGWVAFDPTNAICAGLDHVTVAWGRDYTDVAPLRGVIRGGGVAVPQVAVTVETLPAGAQWAP
jgi:transglutaminase-like putative cysteine protease